MNETSSRFWPVVVCLLALGSLAAASTLTKDDIIQMSQDGRSEQAILDSIHDAHATFDLTADDIAGLRQAGVSEAVIDALLETRPGQAATVPEAAQPQGPEPGSPISESAEANQEEPPPAYVSPAQPPLEPDVYYPEPPPIAYPIYPLYYPVYYPIYDPFLSFYGGFFFPFQFIHVSHLMSVFPCDHSFLVVRSPRGTGGGFVGSRSAVFSTPRTLPRGSVLHLERGVIARAGAGVGSAAGAPAPRGAWSHPARMAGARLSAPAALRPAFPSAPRGMSSPRPRTMPYAGPRVPSAPRIMGGHYGPARSMAGPRAPAPRFSSPSIRAPRPAPMGGGGFHSLGGARASGGGHGSGGAHPSGGPRGHGGHR